MGIIVKQTGKIGEFKVEFTDKNKPQNPHDDNINFEQLKAILNKFPNGFSSWMETHFEMVEHLTLTSEDEDSIGYKRREEQGLGGVYELAEELTDEFEQAHIGVKWDGDYLDAIANFIHEKEGLN
jgi:hypothetical protein